jgi:hypothetical protein
MQPNAGLTFRRQLVQIEDHVLAVEIDIEHVVNRLTVLSQLTHGAAEQPLLQIGCTVRDENHEMRAVSDFDGVMITIGD